MRSPGSVVAALQRPLINRGRTEPRSRCVALALTSYGGPDISKPMMFCEGTAGSLKSVTAIMRAAAQDSGRKRCSAKDFRVVPIPSVSICSKCATLQEIWKTVPYKTVCIGRPGTLSDGAPFPPCCYLQHARACTAYRLSRGLPRLVFSRKANDGAQTDTRGMGTHRRSPWS